jgi:hypothetical protein
MWPLPELVWQRDHWRNAIDGAPDRDAIVPHIVGVHGVVTN